MQILPRLEELGGVDQRIVGALVHGYARRQVPDLERREAVEARLQRPRVARVAHDAQDVPPGVEGHQVRQEAGRRPVVVQDDLGPGGRRRVPAAGHHRSRPGLEVDGGGAGTGRGEGGGRQGEDGCGLHLERYELGMGEGVRKVSGSSSSQSEVHTLWDLHYYYYYIHEGFTPFIRAPPPDSISMFFLVLSMASSEGS